MQVVFVSIQHCFFIVSIGSLLLGYKEKGSVEY